MRRSPDWKVYLALCLLMVVLRQDFWLCNDGRLVLGVLPAGLAWQAGYSLLAALVLWGLVRWDWPAELERLEPPAPDERRSAPDA